MAIFINKDSTSSNVARSTPSERRLINERSREHRGSARNSSASTSARQRRRPIQSHSEHASGTSTKARQAPWRIDTHADDNEDNLSSTTFHPGQLVLASSSPTSDTSSSSWESSISCWTPTTASETSRSGSSSPTYSIRIRKPTPLPILGNPIDPFEATTHIFTPSTLHLINYYKTIYYTTIWATVDKTLSSYIRSSPTRFTVANPVCTPDNIIQNALQNTNRMSCLLASTGSHMTLSSSQGPTHGAQIRSLALLQRGTTALLDELSQISLRADNDILMSAMHLCLAASRIGMSEAAMAHLRGVRAMVGDILAKGGGITLSNLGVLSLIDTNLAVELLAQSGFGMREGRVNEESS